ncbi:MULTISPECIES: hypothetical protein [Elizabethkingia]|uniref:hypothetical protein n=1 Tax=Elizabethkingia TaxID=308865 RepID=UPI000998EB1C|nr:MULTISPECIES: hypothetical protein [Elizabethkingia]AQX90984.1 hypothetical protein AYC67_16635 [Elizabethkingia anophelis]EHM7980958.1 hypothetical protein [Elizabethkingia anophelis]EHM8032177.1 hypothetical protein [Elizabethkingia anophelis]EHM8033930.1 hypothetical protein [Elizabethkingia anophelis]EHZ9535131.1 hypothetical protein [Elizabethkingia anophelis]
MNIRKNKFISSYTIFMLMSIMLVFSCAPSINYIGKNYNPTEKVDVYLDTNDIKKNYEVIGKVDGISGILGSSYEDIQNKIIQTARQKGADAVILYNMERRVIGTTSSASTEHRQWLKSSTVGSTSNVTEDILHADFIKYVNN